MSLALSQIVGFVKSCAIFKSPILLKQSEIVSCRWTKRINFALEARKRRQGQWLLPGKTVRCPGHLSCMVDFIPKDKHMNSPYIINTLSSTQIHEIMRKIIIKKSKEYCIDAPQNHWK